MAEAGLSFLQTCSSSLVIFSSYHHDFSAQLLGRLRAPVLFEFVAYGVALVEASQWRCLEATVRAKYWIEVVSHSLFLALLSSSFRRTALGMVRRREAVEVEPHTLHTQHQRREIPRKAARNLVVEDVL